MKNTQLRLKTELLREEIFDTIVYYSLVKKDAQMLSFWTHDRLLVYDDKRRILFYINDFENTPFKDKIPQPKNNSMPINLCNFSNPITTTNLQVRYTGKNSKGELQTTEWNFAFESIQLLKEWIALLENEKNRLVEKETGEKGAGFVHDTLMEGMKADKPASGRETILKPEEQVIKYVVYPETKSELKNSRLSNSNANIKPANEPVGPSESNIRSTNKDPKRSDINEGFNSGIKPQNSGIRNSNANLGVPSDNKNPSKISNDGEYLQTSEVKPINSSGLRESNNRNISGIRGSNISNSNLKNKEDQYPVLPQNLNSKAEKPKDKNEVDWNHRFLKEPTEATIQNFQEEAMKALMAIWNKDVNSLKDPRRVYDSNGFIIAVANCFTKEASLLKKQFRNYHFIIEACKSKLVVGVPLCSLIQWEGVVALVKAPLPKEAEEVKLEKVVLQVRDLQRYTRVSNNSLEKCNLWDVTNIYGSNGQHKLIYLDGLVEYLPIHLEQEMNGCSVRPEYLLDSVNQVIPGGDLRGVRGAQKALASALEGLSGSFKELVEFLNCQQTIWVDSLQLKQIFHNHGINFKLLPRVYNSVGSKHVKKYLQSVMAAKVAKDHLYDNLFQNRKNENRVPTQLIVQNYIRLLLEGNSSNSSELWKEINVKFKKQYAIPLSNTEIIPGFFLNSLLKLMRVRVDMSKLAKGKKMFKQEKIVNEGFVVGVDPKVKSYYRYSTEFVEKIRYACREQKKDHQVYDEIIEVLQLKGKPLPKQYSFNNNQQPVLEYLAYYTAPPDLDPNAELKHIPIYEALLREPPSAFSLRITKSYLEWAIKKEKNEEFKKGVTESLNLSQFWLEDGHVFQTDLLQLLSDFYSSQANYEESINYMKEALSKTVRTCGAHSKAAGNKFFELADRELKAGRKKEALDNYLKAKLNMETNKTETIKYPLTLMRIASLRLNSGDIDACIEQSLNSINKFSQYDRKSGNPSLTEGYKVKTFQILARAYQISSRRDKLKQMAILCAKQFNSAKTQWTYQQMTRICLAAAIFNNTPEKCQQFLKFCSKMQKEQEPLDPSAALKDLMTLSQTFTVMQKFLVRFDSLERITNEVATRKQMNQDSRDFLLICKRLTTVVGEDYIEGLVQQKQYE